MREILFRGKTAGGKWVFGSLVHRTQFYGDPCDDYLILVDGEFHCDYYDADEVITETIGQFTGLTDKNGKKIFEGDIVEGHCHSRWRHDVQRCEIAYYRDGFEARHHVKCGEEERYYSYKVLFSKDVVVIGNIHDNPELLERRK